MPFASSSILSDEERRVRRVADGDEHAVERKLTQVTGLEIADDNADNSPCRHPSLQRPRIPDEPIFGLAIALSCMIFDARSVSRRWTTETLVAKRVR